MHCTLHIVLCVHVTPVINNTVPPGHLSDSQRGGPGDTLQTCTGPSKSSFLPTFLWVWHLQESRRGFICCHSCPWHRTAAHIWKLAFRRGQGRMAGCFDCTGKKKHLRKKSPPPLLKIYYYNNTIRGTRKKKKTHDIISGYLRSWGCIYICFSCSVHVFLGAMHWSITKLAWRISNHLNQGSGNFT